MRVYLDNCCFNRPFDDQHHIRVRLEAEAKLDVQARIEAGELDLIWSYILDYENAASPFEERRELIAKWKEHAEMDLSETPAILEKAMEIQAKGIRSKDALHVACAIEAKAVYFLTTDDPILTKLSDLQDIKVVDPTEFIRRLDQ